MSLQAILDAGGIIELPSGVTPLAAPLRVWRRGSGIVGKGPGQSILQVMFPAGDVIQVGSDPPITEITLRDFSMEATPGLRTSGWAITCDGVEYGTLAHLRIVQVGHGIWFSPSGRLSSLIDSHHVDVELGPGPWIGARISGSNDQWLDRWWVRGQHSLGSIAYLIEQSGGCWLDDCEGVLCERGCVIAPPAGQVVAWANFDNLLVDTNSLHGLEISGAGEVWGLTFDSLWSGSNGLSTINGRGVLARNGRTICFAHPRIKNNGGHGMEFGPGVRDVRIAGGAGYVADNSLASPGAAHGVIATGIKGLRINGLRVGPLGHDGLDSQGVGIFLNTGCDQYVVTENDCRGNRQQGLFAADPAGPTRIVRDNLT